MIHINRNAAKKRHFTSAITSCYVKFLLAEIIYFVILSNCINFIEIFIHAKHNLPG